MTQYVAEFGYISRDAAHEPGRPAEYWVILGEWRKGPLGYEQVFTTKLTPAQADARGFPLDKILGKVTHAALLKAGAAEAAMLSARAELDQAVRLKAAAWRDRDEAKRAQTDAELDRAIHAGKRQAKEEELAAAQVNHKNEIAALGAGHEEFTRAALERIRSLDAEIKATLAYKGVANPLLHRLTFGRFGG